MVISFLNITEISGITSISLNLTSAPIYGASMGMPQLDFSTYPSQIFWLLCSLGILYVLLSQIVLPRIEAVIQDRQDTISTDLDKAAEFKRRAEEAEMAYEESLSLAYRKAEKISQKTREETQKNLVDALAKADREIEEKAAQSRQRIEQIETSAKKMVENVSHDLVSEIITTVLHDTHQDADTLIKTAQANIAQN
jgi:F-type H+-transporting ATPase subunit b